MSFYGNIANGGKTNLTFDKIYSNRMHMDNSAQTDGIFVGRFVLVEYDDNTFSRRVGFNPTLIEGSSDQYIIYSDTTNTIPYAKADAKEKGYSISIDDIVRVNYDNGIIFFKCVEIDVENKAIFEKIILGDSYADSIDYTLNYNIDKNQYEEFIDGWDSTIWQKVNENGSLKYIMIGDLNSKVPRFHVESEAPSLIPIAPHFDSNSTNMDYTLHVQPNWGFRVKEKDSTIPSDVIIQTPYNDYLEPDKTEYDGDIYFNADGFNKLKRSYDDENANIITLLPTGISGRTYYQHDKNNAYEPEVDIQELSIHLPAIGNAVSELWDLMYGDKDLDGNFKDTRNTDVQWESGEEPKRNGTRAITADGAGFNFDDHQLETVAGCINSFHDLMGMIIIEPEIPAGEGENEEAAFNKAVNDALNNADTNHIYYGPLATIGRSGYFMKTKKNIYKEIDKDNIANYTNYKQYYDLTQYEKNNYHIKINEDFYAEIGENPTQDTSYYDLRPKKSLDDNQQEIEIVIAQPVSLTSWVQDTTPDDGSEKNDFINYWQDDETKDYIKDINKVPDPNKVYYSLKMEAATTLTSNVAKEKYKYEIYKPTPRTVKRQNGCDIYTGYIYYVKRELENDIVAYDNIVYELMPQIFDEDGNPVLDENGNPTFADAGELRSDATYFYTSYQIIPGTQNGQLVYPLCDMNGDPFNASNMPNPDNEVRFIKFEDNVYYSYYSDFTMKDNENNDIKTTGYKALQSLDDYTKHTVYFTIEATPVTGILDVGTDENGEPISTFVHYYIPNVYHYQPTNTNDYIFGIEEEQVPGVQYYKIPKDLNAITIKFYEPSKYYYEINDNGNIIQILDNNTSMKNKSDEDSIITNENGLIYFTKPGLYVITDSKGILSPGSIWDSGINPPDSLVLGQLEEDQYEWKELKGFARTLNTIHGMLLKLNQYFKFDDTLTRDRSTVQGCLNRINDIINDFGALIPGEIAVIDEYGRIKSATIFTTASDGSTEDGWISVDVDPNPIETKITIRHNNAKEVSNEDLVGQLKNDAPGFGGAFKTVGFGIDEKGHVDPNQFNDYQITLPSLGINDTIEKQILTNLEFTHNNEDNGKIIKISRENVGNFKLTGYDIGTSTDNIGATDTINQAFGKLQSKLNKEIEDRVADVDAEERARIDAINALNMAEDSDSTQFISKISQTNGQLSVTRAYAGTLGLGNGYQIAGTAADVNTSDSINSAFGKIEAKLKVLNSDASTTGSVAYQIAQIIAGADQKYDTLKEIADWIINDEIGVSTITTNISNMQNQIATLNQTIASLSEEIETLKNTINSLKEQPTA